MPAQSPSSSTTHLSPRQAPVNPNVNPFAPLSPDVVAPTLDADNTDNTPRSNRPFVFYSRAKLLSISKACKGARPPKLGGLETWYGPAPAPRSPTQPVQDPAIASIGQSSTGSQPGRRGGSQPGFGEGFGFGGGIGGATRGLGRGGRQGQRRQPESSQDESRDVTKGGARFERSRAVAEDKRASEKSSRRDDGEWRRNERPPFVAASHREQGDDSSQPAWMNDGPDDTIDPAIVTPSSSDPLIKFTPGEDMIALHKRNMKARDTGAAWRGEKSLVSFFGSEKPAETHSKQPAPVREFNAERYLLPKKQEAESSETTSSATSRFQRFFSPPPAAVPAESPASTGLRGQSTTSENRATSRAALLMNTLKGPGPSSQGPEAAVIGAAQPKPLDPPHPYLLSEQPTFHFDHANPSQRGRDHGEISFAPAFPPPWSQGMPEQAGFRGDFAHPPGDASGLPYPRYGEPLIRDPPHAPPANLPYEFPNAQSRAFQSGLPLPPQTGVLGREVSPSGPASTHAFPHMAHPSPPALPYPSRPINAPEEPNEQAQRLLAALFAGAGRPPQR